MHSQFLQQRPLDQQQQYLMQQQMQKYQYQDHYGGDGQSYHYDPNQQVNPSESFRSGNDYDNTPGSKYSMHNQQEQNFGMNQMYTNQQEEDDNYEYSKTPSIYSSKPGRDDNFKVIIRVRPPLPREQEPSCPFRSCLHISPDNKNISLMEYMGAEVNEAERQLDIQENPQL